MFEKVENETLGEYMERLRKSKGYSQRKLALVTGISNTTINRIEKGETPNPEPSTLKILAKALDVDEAYILKIAGIIEDKRDIGLTPKDEKNIEKDIDALRKKLETQDGLMLSGEIATPEAIQSLLDAMKVGMEIARQRNKDKYTPKKYRKNK